MQNIVKERKRAIEEGKRWKSEKKTGSGSGCEGPDSNLAVVGTADDLLIGEKGRGTIEQRESVSRRDGEQSGKTYTADL